MLIRGSGAEHWQLGSGSDDPQAILRQMMACLQDLDRIEAGLAAVHLETAIQHLCRQFGIEPDSSGTD